MYDLLLLNIVRDNSLASGFMECLGQHSIASYLSCRGYSARVFSGKTNDVKHVINNEIKNGIRCVGLYASSDNINIVTNITKWIKHNYELSVIIGGPEAVSCNEEFMRVTNCDGVIENEGEEPVKLFLDYIIKGAGERANIPNLKYIDEEDKYNKNPNSYYVADLDEIPFPRHENSLNKRFRMGSMVGIITGRGCPFSCAFCYEGANAKNVRFRSIKDVMEEIDYIIDINPDLSIINIYDDTFTLDRDRVYEFCDEIARRDLYWVCEAHISNIVKYPEMIEYMIKSGLVGIQIGIESGSDKVLKAYNKHTTSDDILEAVMICKKYKLPHLTGNFIIGGAMEDYDTFNESFELAKKMVEAGRGMFECRTVFLSPYPNTQISESPEKFGLHPVKELIEHTVYTMHNPVMATDKLSVKDITKLRDKFNQELEKKYFEQAKKSTREEIERIVLRSGRLRNRVHVWRDFYEKIEHINSFIGNALLNKIEYSEEYYPIRTFNDPDYVDMLDVTKNEKEFLLHSDGKHSISDISKKLYMKPVQAKKMYYRLFNRCLVYLSEF